ncbi:MAG: cytochrome c [Gammaproteobacteria bacterium]
MPRFRHCLPGSARAIALAAGLAAANAVAAPPPDAAARMLAGNCYTCHGPGGHSPGAIPSIAGADADFIRERLRAFRDDDRATIMNRIARGYTDAEIDRIAAAIAPPH